MRAKSCWTVAKDFWALRTFLVALSGNDLLEGSYDSLGKSLRSFISLCSRLSRWRVRFAIDSGDLSFRSSWFKLLPCRTKLNITIWGTVHQNQEIFFASLPTESKLESNHEVKFFRCSSTACLCPLQCSHSWSCCFIIKSKQRMDHLIRQSLRMIALSVLSLHGIIALQARIGDYVTEVASTADEMTQLKIIHSCTAWVVHEFPASLEQACARRQHSQYLERL